MNIQELIELYEKGLSLNQLHTKYGISQGKIKNILIENGVTVRTRSEQNVITNLTSSRGMKVDHLYFDVIDSGKKAYIMGLLAAIGYLKRNRNVCVIKMSRVDREILERIKEEIGIERDITDYETWSGQPVSSLEWSSLNQRIQLSKYRISPDKSFKKVSMEGIPKEFHFNYLMGYYDGVGKFDVHGTFEVTAPHEWLLQEFADLIKEKFGAEAEVFSRSTPKTKHYVLAYSSDFTESILKMLYEINELYIKRKYDKFQDWLKTNNRI